MKALVLMGVSGCGKTSVGRLLASEIGGEFVDGDDFHSEENVCKMSAGIPLTDGDRQGWLEDLAKVIRDADGTTIIACSALKARYRRVLVGAEFALLDGPVELLAKRLRARTDHYMPPELLESQLEALERPDGALILDIRETPEDLVEKIRKSYGW